ncbi:MAG: N-glycosylase/DNA lyase [Acidobacteria bacterium]|nr:N-glycosylase/DNA lyase [Acidobacteriota bacterium]
MKKEKVPLTFENIRAIHLQRQDEIKGRLAEFRSIWLNGSDLRLWEEMVFCFFTGGCSAKMGLRSIEAIRHLLVDGSQQDLASALTGVHRYPNARSRYVVASRDYLTEHCGLRLREKLFSFSDDMERRDWLVKDKGIKGLGYKEASHYLRNIGFSGYAILDKHVLNCLAELGLIDDPSPPTRRDRYIATETAVRELSADLNIDMDEMDLVLWSMKTGEILK